jgi:hypothetical protein
MKTIFSINAAQFAWQNDWCNNNLNYHTRIVDEEFQPEIISIEERFDTFFNVNHPTLFNEYLHSELFAHNKNIDFESEFLFPVNIGLEGVTIEIESGFLESEMSEVSAIYDSKKRQVTYFQQYFNASFELKQIITIQARMHAFLHLNWKAYPKTSSIYREFLAQLFTFKAVEGTYLERIFEDLSNDQADIYCTWIPYKNFTIDEVIDLFTLIKEQGILSDDFLDGLAFVYDAYAVNYDPAKKREL